MKNETYGLAVIALFLAFLYLLFKDREEVAVSLGVRGVGSIVATGGRKRRETRTIDGSGFRRLK